MPLKPSQLFDPMPETKKYFKRRLKNCPIDYKSFATPLRLCEMEDCRGMCCYDGVCLDESEEHYITAIVNAHPNHFKKLGITVDNAFEDAEFLGSPTRKTATKPCTYPEKVEFPEHFEDTSCIFRHKDGRCSLQALAMEHGEHPWAYKPPSCWLHPISLERDDQSILWLPTRGKDHVVDEDYPGYSSYTRCGECVVGEQPAYESLKPELDVLGAIIGRDFYAEIKEALTNENFKVKDAEEDKGKKKKKKKKKK